jgi:hypothetical protein
LLIAHARTYGEIGKIGILDLVAQIQVDRKMIVSFNIITITYAENADPENDQPCDRSKKTAAIVAVSFWEICPHWLMVAWPALF